MTRVAQFCKLEGRIVSIAQWQKCKHILRLCELDLTIVSRPREIIVVSLTPAFNRNVTFLSAFCQCPLSLNTFSCALLLMFLNFSFAVSLSHSTLQRALDSTAMSRD